MLRTSINISSWNLLGLHQHSCGLTLTNREGDVEEDDGVEHYQWGKVNQSPLRLQGQNVMNEFRASTNSLCTYSVIAQP